MRQSEEAAVVEVLRAARHIQEFLWGESNGAWGLEEWRRMFRKRCQKIDDIDVTKPHAVVELRKRLLQNASLSIALLALVDEGRVPAEESTVPSALPEYARR